MLCAEPAPVLDELGKTGYQLVFSIPSSEEPGIWSQSDTFWMRRALELASFSCGDEVPVGAVVVSGGEVLGEGWNHPVESHDPTAHAEIAAIRQASLHTRNYRLVDATLYVTLEPCVMCAGAIVSARIARLVYAARELRFGAVRSKFRLVDSDLLNHRARVEEGLLAAEAAEQMQRFFRLRRQP